MTARPLNQTSGMPQLKAAFLGWTMPISLTKRTQTVTKGLVSYVDSVVKFRGIIQPLKPQEISLKPEGQRSWEWLQIHCQTGSVSLNTDDQIIYNSKKYKIMLINNYDLNGFIEYHAVSEYQP